MFNFTRIGQTLLLLSFILASVNGDAASSHDPSSTPIHEDFDDDDDDGNVIFYPLNDEDDDEIDEIFEKSNEKNDQLVCFQRTLITFKSGVTMLNNKLQQLISSKVVNSSDESTHHRQHKFAFTLTSEELADLNATMIKLDSLMVGGGGGGPGSMSTHFCNHLDQYESRARKMMNKLIKSKFPLCMSSINNDVNLYDESDWWEWMAFWWQHDPCLVITLSMIMVSVVGLGWRSSHGSMSMIITIGLTVYAFSLAQYAKQDMINRKDDGRKNNLLKLIVLHFTDIIVDSVSHSLEKLSKLREAMKNDSYWGQAVNYLTGPVLDIILTLVIWIFSALVFVALVFAFLFSYMRSGAPSSSSSKKQKSSEENSKIQLLQAALKRKNRRQLKINQ